MANIDIDQGTGEVPGPWAVYDANQDPERRIAVGGSLECAEELRKLYLHVTPDVNPRWVYLATAEVTA